MRRERGNNVFLVRGNDSTGRPAWYFVLVDPAKRAAFRKAFSGQLQLNAYGRILASGFGAEPPPDVRERMKTEYGFTESSECRVRVQTSVTTFHHWPANSSSLHAMLRTTLSFVCVTPRLRRGRGAGTPDRARKGLIAKHWGKMQKDTVSSS